jgi:hypothetical protein
MRSGLVSVCVLALTGCGILRGGPPSEPDTVAEALVDAEAGDVSGFANGDRAYLEGEPRPDPDPGSGHPVVWAHGVGPPEDVERPEEE